MQRGDPLRRWLHDNIGGTCRALQILKERHPLEGDAWHRARQPAVEDRVLVNGLRGHIDPHVICPIDWQFEQACGCGILRDLRIPRIEDWLLERHATRVQLGQHQQRQQPGAPQREPRALQQPLHTDRRKHAGGEQQWQCEMPGVARDLERRQYGECSVERVLRAERKQKCDQREQHPACSALPPGPAPRPAPRDGRGKRSVSI